MKNWKEYAVICQCLLWIPMLHAQTPALDTFLAAPSLKRAHVGLVIKDTDSGTIIMQHNADRLVAPASILKLLTTATALELLKPDFRFSTSLQYDGYITDSTLHGNIYIQGGGDPTLGSQYFDNKDVMRTWVEAVRKLGIKKINGTITGDASLFDTEGISPEWRWVDMGNYYAAGAYGISIFDNKYELTFKSGAVGTTPQIIGIEPNIPALQFNNYLKSGTLTFDSAFIYGAPFDNNRYIHGAIPAHRSSFVVQGDIPNPPLFSALFFTQQLKNEGITITKPASVEFERKEKKLRKTFHTTQSPPLIDIIANINHRSNNHYAEHLFRYLALQADSIASSGKAIAVIKNFWLQQAGLDFSQMLLHDGSGLAPTNAITAHSLAELLLYEKNKSPHSEVFISSLPLAGQTGSVKNFLKNTILEGKVKLKSGSMSGVQCFAGYIEWKDKTYVFAVLVNHFVGARRETVSQIEKLLLSLTK